MLSEVPRNVIQCYFLKAINLLVDGKQVTIDSIVNKTTELPEAIANINNEIEEVEILLRNLLDLKLHNLDNDPYICLYQKRQGCRLKVKSLDTLKNSLEKNIENFKVFRKKLNFFTLGEFQALIVQKKCWGEFEDIFKSKPNLENRFNQLFTLRNQIAHNNELNDIMIKDGEAALLWFKDILLP